MKMTYLQQSSHKYIYVYMIGFMKVAASFIESGLCSENPSRSVIDEEIRWASCGKSSNQMCYHYNFSIICKIRE